MRKSTITKVIIVLLIPVGIFTAVKMNQTGSAGDSSAPAPASSSVESTQWFNDTADQLVVEVVGPGEAQQQANLLMASGQWASPQSSNPGTANYLSTCSVTFPGGIIWQVFDNSAGSETSAAAEQECNDIGNQPGANITWNN